MASIDSSMSGSDATGTHRIVIVGGGAGGLELATRLGRRYGRHGRIEVALVDRTRTHMWKPLLHAVAAGNLNIHDEQQAVNRAIQDNGPTLTVARSVVADWKVSLPTGVWCL